MSEIKEIIEIRVHATTITFLKVRRSGFIEGVGVERVEIKNL